MNIDKIKELYKISQEATGIYSYPLSGDKEKEFREHLISVISSPGSVTGRTFAQTKFLEYLYAMVPARKRDRLEASKHRVSKEKYYSSRYREIYSVINNQSPSGPTIIVRNFLGFLNRDYSDKFNEIITEAIGN